MPELGFSLQIEVYFLRGTYEFARPDHPNVYTFSRFVAEWSARCSICYDSHLNDAPKHIPQQHIHPAKTENYRMHLKTIKFAIKFNINAKTWLLNYSSKGGACGLCRSFSFRILRKISSSTLTVSVHHCTDNIYFYFFFTYHQLQIAPRVISIISTVFNL